MRFTIRWDRHASAYKVSVPNYDGGEVVVAKEYDRLKTALQAIASPANNYDIETAQAVARAILANARNKEDWTS